LTNRRHAWPVAGAVGSVRTSSSSFSELNELQDPISTTSLATTIAVVVLDAKIGSEVIHNNEKRIQRLLK
jgi:hypothetical protein